jgi:hypothetical protein
VAEVRSDTPLTPHWRYRNDRLPRPLTEVAEVLSEVDPLWRDQKYRERFATGGLIDWDGTDRKITAGALYDKSQVLNY